jgi:hypothetical protein
VLAESRTLLDPSDKSIKKFGATIMHTLDGFSMSIGIVDALP